MQVHGVGVCVYMYVKDTEREREKGTEEFFPEPRMCACTLCGCMSVYEFKGDRKRERENRQEEVFWCNSVLQFILSFPRSQ